MSLSKQTHTHTHSPQCIFLKLGFCLSKTIMGCNKYWERGSRQGCCLSKVTQRATVHTRISMRSPTVNMTSKCAYTNTLNYFLHKSKTESEILVICQIIIDARWPTHVPGTCGRVGVCMTHVVQVSPEMRLDVRWAALFACCIMHQSGSLPQEPRGAARWLCWLHSERPDLHRMKETPTIKRTGTRF